ncbi:xylulokinase [Oceanobacillus iheyensis]|uniref:Xylulose kinase n=1 Tax=Oceanobacillus iheyensis (strain DSM 14371 / CIP 107618 / JCM 11309 / KCTC 3954 / HTE831) TaxID=221109 RepID=Q8CX70_OCEIH|nr:xylulokinase [Oceanobacillus iheyensis]BAC15074.1 xylose kinase (xylulokinase) [Oceanobacillus iheyensis HTE831]
MSYVLGVDLGTSGVKVLLVNKKGKVEYEKTKSLTLIQEKTGYAEQDPDEWVSQTYEAIKELVTDNAVDPAKITGLSFAGQMHGLVLLNNKNQVIRNAILWNDTRTSEECQEIYSILGEDRLLEITKNIALEGFTLPKLLWVKKHEPINFAKTTTFLLPKDYVRYQLTGKLHMDYSDAAGTLLLDVEKNRWSKEICELFEIPTKICPELINSIQEVGTLTEEASTNSRLNMATKVFAGGADNACAAIGSGVLSKEKTLASIGTSGVVLSYEESGDKKFEGKVHYFNHGAPDAFYTMGVTLAAGHSLSWFKETFAHDICFDELIQEASTVNPGANGLLFTPYINGERTPHVDANIRGSFIGIDASHKRQHFTRAVLEGITFSLQESVTILRESGKKIESIISLGGGAKSDLWLQMQADIFQANVIRLTSEQGPGMGAAMIASVGVGWFNSLADCGDVFIQEEKVYKPIEENVKVYHDLFLLYKEVYSSTTKINKQLREFRN